MGESALEPGPVPGAPAGGPVHAVTVVTLLEKLATMLEALRERQGGLAQRQGSLASSVSRIQSGLGALSRSHDTTSNTLVQLLAKAERVGSHADAAQERAVHRAALVQRLEANHGLLVARGKLHVLLFKVSDLSIPQSGTFSCLQATIWGLSLPIRPPHPHSRPCPAGTDLRAPPTARPSLPRLNPAWPIKAWPAQDASTEFTPSFSPSLRENSSGGSASPLLQFLPLWLPSLSHGCPLSRSHLF